MDVTTHSIGLHTRSNLTVTENLELVQYAEKLGFDSIWQDEYRLARDAIAPAGAYAGATDEIRIGLAVINNWTRNAALIAQTLSTLAEIAGPDRIVGGIGAWWEPIASQVGVDRRTPLLALRETVEVIRALLAGETVSYDGEFVQVDDISLGFVDGVDRRDVPVYIGATGPDMLELTGQYADGCIMNYLVDPEYTEAAIQRLETGVSRAGRSIDEIGCAQLILCAVDADADVAIDTGKRFLAQYAANHPDVLTTRGTVDQTLIEDIAALADGWPAADEDIDRATQIIPDNAVQSVVACGTPTDCREQVQQFIDAGCDLPIINPIGDDPFAVADVFEPQ